MVPFIHVFIKNIKLIFIKLILWTHQKMPMAEIGEALKKLGTSNDQLFTAYVQGLKSDHAAYFAQRFGQLGDSRAIEKLWAYLDDPISLSPRDSPWA